MPGRLTIKADWEHLDEGSPEERACFAAIGILWNETWLTEGRDSFVKVVRNAPFLSGYHLAEWLAWNWWRLRWEPGSQDQGWAFAHRMSTIGGGYIWPNITMFSDGQRSAIIAKPTLERASTPYRYITDFAAVLAAGDFESTIDEFIETVRGRLRSEGIEETNLDKHWADVTQERRDPDLTRFRKFEALLGCEADESNEAVLRKLFEDSQQLGEEAMCEVAAHHDKGFGVLTAKNLREIAEHLGLDCSVRDAFRLRPDTRLPRVGDVAAWKLGTEAAQATRDQSRFRAGPISDGELENLSGVGQHALDEPNDGSRIAFALDTNANQGRIVFRSKWKTGRRFELARILGDRLLSRQNGPLFPATRSHTYRQKFQRSFAAELLSPFEAVNDELQGDYSDEAQQDLADQYQVSPFTIRPLLVNHGCIDREVLDADLEFAVV